MPVFNLALALLSGCTTPTPVDTADDALPPDPPDAPGFQLHIGPFDVPEGEEVQTCTALDFPGDEPVDVTRIRFTYTDGSHHVNVFRTENPDFMQPDGTVQDECWDALDFDNYTLVANSQLTRLDWTLPDEVAAPLGPESQFLVQVHYVNIEAAGQTTSTGVGDVYVDFFAEPAGTRPNQLGSLFANDRSISLPPHQYSSFSASCVLPEGSNVVALAGHFHRHGVEFTANRFLAATDTRDASFGELVYDSEKWEEPTFQTYDAGQFVIGADEGIGYTCDFYNDSDETIVFGPHVETEEHCNLFGYYFPAQATSTYCF